MIFEKKNFFSLQKNIIRGSVSGCGDFVAMHALIATWKSVTFLGNSLLDLDLKPVYSSSSCYLKKKFELI